MSIALGTGIAAALAAALSASPAGAQAPFCSDVTTLAVSFTNYDGNTNTPLDAQGQVRVVCDATTPYVVSLGPGDNSGGTFSPRRMARIAGTYFLEYNLFVDSARTLIWGDGTGATEVVSDTSQGAQNVHQVFGRLFPGQPVGVGVYTDAVLVSVDF